MAAIGDLVATMGMNTKPFAAGATRTKGMLKRMEVSTLASAGRMKAAFAGFGGLLGTLGIGLGIGALVMGTKKAVAAATVQEQAEKKLQAVLQATGHAAGFSAKELQEYASDLQKVTNYGDEATISAMGILATFKNISGDMFKDTVAAVQDISAVMGTDMKSAAIQVGKALNDPLTGMSMLSRSGITFTEEQKKQVKLLTQQGDLLGAQKLMMTELQSQFGGAAKGMADPLKQAGNTIGDLWEKVGGFIKPVFVAIANGFLSAIAWIGKFKAQFVAIGAAIWSYWSAQWSLVANIVSAVFGYMGVSAGGFEKTIRSVLEWIANYFNVMAFAARNFVNLTKLAFNGLVLYALEIFPSMEGPIVSVGATFISVWAGVKAFFGSIVGNIIGGLKEIKNFGLAVGAAISAIWESLTSGDFAGAASAAADAFINTLANQKDVIAPNAFAEFRRAYKDAGAEFREGIEESGGLGGWLREQQAGILRDIATGEAAHTAMQRREQATAAQPAFAFAGAPSAAGAGAAAAADKAKKDELPKAMERGSAEAWKKTVQAMYGTGKNKPAEQTAKNTERTAKAVEDLAQRDTDEATIP